MINLGNISKISQHNFPWFEERKQEVVKYTETFVKINAIEAWDDDRESRAHPPDELQNNIAHNIWSISAHINDVNTKYALPKPWLRNQL